MRSLQAAIAAFVAVAAMGVGQPTYAQTDESLELIQPDAPRVIPVMNPGRKFFINYVFWFDQPRDIGALIHKPDTTGWNAPTSTTPQDALSEPSADGAYTGTIDRTINFLARTGGMVGDPGSILLRYEIQGDEEWSHTIDLAAPYVPGAPIPMIFISSLTTDTLDLGVDLAFSTGVVDSNGVFTLCIEDFEGFHVWRGIKPDASDLTIMGELSKQEEHAGSVLDSVYFNAMIPALRETGVYRFPGPVTGLGDVIDIRQVHPNGKLGPNEFVWPDWNAFNGFTYYYTVTTFDKGYDCRSGRQGLEKFDSCDITEGVPYPCPKSLTSVSTRNTPQDDLYRVYAVPNPYRSGSTQFTTLNYHNYPDGKMRFVNVPARCRLKVYTPAGDAVWQFTQETGDGVIEWDTRNTSGELVSSGIYMYKVETFEGESVFGRIVIIR